MDAAPTMLRQGGSPSRGVGIPRQFSTMYTPMRSDTAHVDGYLKTKPPSHLVTTLLSVSYPNRHKILPQVIESVRPTMKVSIYPFIFLFISHEATAWLCCAWDLYHVNAVGCGVGSYEGCVSVTPSLPTVDKKNLATKAN